MKRSARQYMSISSYIAWPVLYASATQAKLAELAQSEVVMICIQ